MRDDLNDLNQTNRVMPGEPRESGMGLGVVGALVAVAAIVALMVAFSGTADNSGTSTASNPEPSTVGSTVGQSRPVQKQPAPAPAAPSAPSTGQTQ